MQNSLEICTIVDVSLFFLLVIFNLKAQLYVRVSRTVHSVILLVFDPYKRTTRHVDDYYRH